MFDDYVEFHSVLCYVFDVYDYFLVVSYLLLLQPNWVDWQQINKWIIDDFVEFPQYIPAPFVSNQCLNQFPSPVSLYLLRIHFL